mmetsp:Transcript_162002/g.519398  ORF Transcript_162002/g.519398 Transcript_162002/m.519398 type:complete len:175 (-) Transcript_162002:386-910(-)
MFSMLQLLSVVCIAPARMVESTRTGRGFEQRSAVAFTYQVLGGLSKLMAHFCDADPRIEALRTEVSRDMSCASAYLKCGWQVERSISTSHYPPMWVKGSEFRYERELVLEVFGIEAGTEIIDNAGQRERRYKHPLAIGNDGAEDLERRAALESAGFKPRVGSGALLLTLRLQRK